MNAREVYTTVYRLERQHANGSHSVTYSDIYRQWRDINDVAASFARLHFRRRNDDFAGHHMILPLTQKWQRNYFVGLPHLQAVEARVAAEIAHDEWWNSLEPAWQAFYNSAWVIWK